MRSCTNDGRGLVVTGDGAGQGGAEDQETQFELPKQLKQHFLEVSNQHVLHETGLQFPCNLMHKAGWTRSINSHGGCG